MQLFIDRACAAAPGLVFDADSGPVAARICRRLDGIPLAIELAAARMKMLSMAQVSERLDERFRLLTGGARALPRQQTLRAVIQWSFEHLGPAEQRLLRALSACSGGCDLAAAVALQGDAADEMATLDSLARLVDKSLLTVERHAQNVRYAMLETVRQYALERLGDSGELLAVRHRHLDHFLTVAEQMGCQPTGDAVQTVWVRLAPEGDNLTRALAWCSGAEGAQRGLRMVHALRNYWPSQGLLVTGYQATTEALAHPGAQQRDLWRCKALAAAAHLCCLLGGPQEHAHAEELLAIATEIADEPYQARALWHLAKIRAELGDMEGARRCGEESLTLARSSGDEVEALNSLGGLAFQAKACGAHDQAQRLWEESLAMSQRVNHRIGQAIALVNLASIAIDRRRADSARTSLIQARDVIARVESSQLDQYLVETAAALAALTDDFDLAVKLHRASARRRAELAISPQVLSCEQADDLDRARNALDPEGCAAMDAVAAQISHKQVLAEVSAWLNRWPPAYAVTEPGH